jgi:hypothetical protein
LFYNLAFYPHPLENAYYQGRLEGRMSTPGIDASSPFIPVQPLMIYRDAPVPALPPPAPVERASALGSIVDTYA